MARKFVVLQKSDLTMLVVPTSAIMAVKEKDGKVVVMLPCPAGIARLLEVEEVVLADTMSMVVHKLGAR